MLHWLFRMLCVYLVVSNLKLP